MQQFATIFVLNLLTSVDNAIVIGGIAGRSRHLLALGVCSAAILTVLRTALIAGVLSVTDKPGWRIILGATVLVIAIGMAHMRPERRARTEPSFLRLLFIILVTDMALSIDNILSLATVSKTLWIIAVGVFISLLPLLLLLPVMARVMDQIAWIRVLAAGFVAELGVDTLTDDKLIITHIPHGTIEVVLRASCAVAVMMYGFWNIYAGRRHIP